MVRTKIIATLGPASSSETVLRKMFISGVDIVRLNFSHGTTAEHEEKIRLVRALNKKMRRAIKIMQDLEGYRLRVGALEGPIPLRKGDDIYLTTEEVTGTRKEVAFDYKGSLMRIKKNTSIYIDDGRIELAVKVVDKKRLKTRVVTPGVLKDRKGINIPGVKLDFEALTKKDRQNVKVAMSRKLDYVAQSFVRDAENIRKLKKIVKPGAPRCGIFAKIESREALANIDSIIDEADGIIIARGDLGICIPIYKVPVAQKEIIRKCREKGKPVVVATQMLDSMTEERLPTRAEVSDVANAILDGATHVFLSGETAVGRHPSKVVDMMNKILEYTEEYKDKL